MNRRVEKQRPRVEFKDEHVDTPSVEDKNVVNTIEIQKVVGSSRRKSFAFGLDFNKALIEVNTKKM